MQVRRNDRQSLQVVCATFVGMLTLAAGKSKYGNTCFLFCIESWRVCEHRIH